MWIQLAGAVLVSCVISALISFYFVRKASNTVAEKLIELHQGVQETITEFSEYLEPIMINNKKMFTMMGKKGLDSQELTKLEEDLGNDLLDKYAPDLELLEATFPRVYERVKDKPDLIIKYWPRFQELLGNTDFAKMGFSIKGRKSDHSRVHREGL